MNLFQIVFSVITFWIFVQAMVKVVPAVQSDLDVSAAYIMPATIPLMKAYFEGAERQRALRYWFIGAWVGLGVCSFSGGAITTYLGWN